VDERNLDKVVDEVATEAALYEVKKRRGKVGQSWTGGFSMLRAWFGNRLAAKASRSKGGSYLGKGAASGQRFKVDKLGGGKYRIKRTG
jgi:hypothetical protein